MAQQTAIVLVKDNFGVQHVTDKFSKLEIVGMEVRSDGKTNVLKFQGINQMAESLAGITAGSTLQVTFEIEGREWTKDDKTTVFMNLNVLSFKLLNSAKEPEFSRGIKAKDIDTSDLFGQAEDDLPF